MSRVLPILFNADMVRAILDGRKTVTRRVVKPQPKGHAALLTENLLPETVEYGVGAVYAFEDGTVTSPPYQPGDILYVRETWQYLYELDGNEQIVEDTGKYYYAATDDLPDGGYVDSRGITHETIPWRPSIHMPKEATRIWLQVTDVLVERLQNITEEQAKAEGAIDNRGFIHSSDNEYDRIHTVREDFSQIWDSNIKKSDLDRYGWAANPWVWVIEFERCEKPESEGDIRTGSRHGKHGDFTLVQRNKKTQVPMGLPSRLLPVPM